MNLDAYFRLNECISRFAQNYLIKRGWYYSLAGEPRNAEGPVPWITYPAFRQLSRLVKPEHKVFEFGCGASSLWWASKTSEVVSVDHDSEWIRKINAMKPNNLSLISKEIGVDCTPEHSRILQPFFDLGVDLPVSQDAGHNITHGLLNKEFTGYVAELLKFPKGYFNIISVDGEARVLSAWLAADYVSDNGIIVFDNADRYQYNAAYHLLSQKGFRRIDFYGPGPSNFIEWCTALFVKDLNVFADNIDSPKGDSDLPW